MNTASTSLRQRLKKIPSLKLAVISTRMLKSDHSLTEKFSLIKAYYRDYRRYAAMPANIAVPVGTENLYPCIYDRTEDHELDPVYFYQDSWCAKKIFENRPSKHYDIASHAHMIGIISQFTPTTMIDIRPIKLSMPGLSFIKGNVTELPFKDGEISSLSSICVIEHIGLGRYGDPLDPFGTEKAVAEMKRVLAKEGNLYISVPVDSESRVYFNAHRAFTRNYILKLFSGMKLVEEQYIYGNAMTESYNAKKSFGTGLYHFKK